MVSPTPVSVQQRRAVLSTNLRQARKRAGLTQEKLALAAGLDRSFYVDVENGHHSLMVDRLWDIADALGIPVAHLFTQSEVGGSPPRGVLPEG